METVLLVIHLLVAIFLVAIILLQNSGGNALSGLGGGNSASSFLSARGKGNLLTKITTILAIGFFVSSVSLSIFYKNPAHKAKSILDGAAVEDIVSDVETYSGTDTENVEDNVPSVPVAGE